MSNTKHTKYEKRVTELESQGITTSDAQAIADLEALRDTKTKGEIRMKRKIEMLEGMVSELSMQEKLKLIEIIIDQFNLEASIAEAELTELQIEALKEEDEIKMEQVSEALKNVDVQLNVSDLMMRNVEKLILNYIEIN